MNAYFAGGCFWCMAKPYDTIPGVTQVVSGYCGGSADDAVYEKVKRQETQHRETVCVSYDPAVVSFSDLLEVYFYNIDPFDDGGQFIDRGRSYTCAIYWTDEQQMAAARDFITRVERETGRTVCVSLEPFTAFYPAEDYHQDYARKNPEAYAEEYVSSGRAGRDSLRALREKHVSEDAE